MVRIAGLPARLAGAGGDDLTGDDAESLLAHARTEYEAALAALLLVRHSSYSRR